MYGSTSLSSTAAAVPAAWPLEQRGRRQSRPALIAAAGRLLKTISYDALMLEKVAAEAGLTRRTVYNQFADKEDLYRSLIEPAIADVAAQLDLDIPVAAPVREALWLFTVRNALVLSGADNVNLVRCVIRDGAKLGWLPAAYARSIRQPLGAAIEVWLLRRSQRAQATDVWEVSESVSSFVFQLEGLVVSPRLHAPAAAEGMPPANERAIDAMVDSFLTTWGLLDPRR